jgi:hypothetical protein
LGLSQVDVGFLLGVHGGGKVCRDERFTRVPTLESALAYEVVFKTPARELFRGLYEQIERNLAERAKVLSHEIERQKPCKKTAMKLRAISNIGVEQSI